MDKLFKDLTKGSCSVDRTSTASNPLMKAVDNLFRTNLSGSELRSEVRSLEQTYGHRDLENALSCAMHGASMNDFSREQKFNEIFRNLEGPRSRSNENPFQSDPFQLASASGLLGPTGSGSSGSTGISGITSASASETTFRPSDRISRLVGHMSAKADPLSLSEQMTSLDQQSFQPQQTQQVPQYSNSDIIAKQIEYVAENIRDSIVNKQLGNLSEQGVYIYVTELKPEVDELMNLFEDLFYTGDLNTFKDLVEKYLLFLSEYPEDNDHNYFVSSANSDEALKIFQRSIPNILDFEMRLLRDIDLNKLSDQKIAFLLADSYTMISTYRDLTSETSDLYNKMLKKIENDLLIMPGGAKILSSVNDEMDGVFDLHNDPYIQLSGNRILEKYKLKDSSISSIRSKLVSEKITKELEILTKDMSEILQKIIDHENKYYENTGYFETFTQEEKDSVWKHENLMYEDLKEKAEKLKKMFTALFKEGNLTEYKKLAKKYLIDDVNHDKRFFDRYDATEAVSEYIPSEFEMERILFLQAIKTDFKDLSLNKIAYLLSDLDGFGNLGWQIIPGEYINETFKKLEKKLMTLPNGIDIINAVNNAASFDPIFEEKYTSVAKLFGSVKKRRSNKRSIKVSKKRSKKRSTRSKKRSKKKSKKRSTKRSNKHSTRSKKRSKRRSNKLFKLKY